MSLALVPTTALGFYPWPHHSVSSFPRFDPSSACFLSFAFAIQGFGAGFLFTLLKLICGDICGIHQ